MRKDGLENLKHPRQIEGKGVRQKHRTPYFVSLSKWTTEQVIGEITKVQYAYRATKDKKMWRDMFTNVLKHRT